MGYDYLLMPVSPVLPWAAGSLSPTNDPQDGLPHVAFTVPWNFAEHPAASLNWRHGADGVPVGVQVVGHRFDDLGVLRLSRTLEIMRPEQASLRFASCVACPSPAYRRLIAPSSS